MTVLLEHEGKVYGIASVSVSRDLATDKEEKEFFTRVPLSTFPRIVLQTGLKPKKLIKELTRA